MRIPVHLRTYQFSLPFGVMLLVHRLLGLSDNLMVAPPPGEPDSANFNLAMAMVFWVGVAAFVVHTGLHAKESDTWVAVKFASLLAVFACLALMAYAVG